MTYLTVSLREHALGGCRARICGAGGTRIPSHSAGIPGGTRRVRGTNATASVSSTAATRLCGSRTPAKESSSPTKRAAG